MCELYEQYVRHGRTEGKDRFALLIQSLINNGKNEDLKRALSDRSYRKQLYAKASL